MVAIGGWQLAGGTWLVTIGGWQLVGGSWLVVSGRWEEEEECGADTTLKTS